MEAVCFWGLIANIDTADNRSAVWQDTLGYLWTQVGPEEEEVRKFTTESSSRSIEV